MSLPRKIALTCLLAATMGCGRDQVEHVVDIPPGISWASLLMDAIDMGNLAVPVPPGVTSRMSSSGMDSNKVMLANLAPKILGDMDHGFFKEVVDEKDGVRATLAEFDGPGVVTWVWSANPTGTIGLFIDGQEAPAIRMSFDDFLGGRFLPVRDPYASVTSLGHNLHFPIVHTSHCKLVVWVPKRENLAELFYQVAWQALPRNSIIHPFDVADISTNSQVLKQLSRRMLALSKANGPRPDEGDKINRTECLLEPGRTSEVFRATGATAITCMRFTAKSKADMKGLWLDGVWDGVTAVHAPLHMLAGVSNGLEDTESLPATVDGPRVTLRWFMPCGAEGRLLVGNTSSETSHVTVEVWSRPIDTSKYPLRFHTNYLRHMGMQTDGGNILTLAEVAGEGRFVGCVLGVDSRSDQWWGEGDHMIWLDDPDHQAWHGTGTEDYFGFAWCSQGIFNHPFRGQTMVAGDQTHRIAHMHRYHILDQLPFRRWGRFQFEAWGLGTGEMDWTTSIMWYSMDGKPIMEDSAGLRTGK